MSRAPVRYVYILASQSRILYTGSTSEWRWEKKLRLIESVNAGWVDLSADWFTETDGRGPSPAPSLREGSGSG